MIKRIHINLEIKTDEKLIFKNIYVTDEIPPEAKEQDIRQYEIIMENYGIKKKYGLMHRKSKGLDNLVTKIFECIENDGIPKE